MWAKKHTYFERLKGRKHLKECFVP